MKSFTGDPGDNQQFVHNLKDVKVSYDVSPRIVKVLSCIACDNSVKLKIEDIREAVLCKDCKEVFKKMKEYKHVV